MGEDEDPNYQRLRILLRGENRYCPDCGRWLVKVSEDGRFDLASGTKLDVDFERKDCVEHVDGTLAVEIYGYDATCSECTKE